MFKKRDSWTREDMPLDHVVIVQSNIVSLYKNGWAITSPDGVLAEEDLFRDSRGAQI